MMTIKYFKLKHWFIKPLLVLRWDVAKNIVMAMGVSTKQRRCFALGLMGFEYCSGFS